MSYTYKLLQNQSGEKYVFLEKIIDFETFFITVITFLSFILFFVVVAVSILYFCLGCLVWVSTKTLNAFCEGHVLLCMGI